MSAPPPSARSGPWAAARQFRVEHVTGAYPVWVGLGLFEAVPDLVAEHVPARKFAVVSDRTVSELYGGRLSSAFRSAGIAVVHVDFPAGEASKTVGEWARLTDVLLEAGLGRDGAVVALGGGVTGDLAGFVSATFMRGVPVVHVPTSLLAMVDASIGGKTGIDTPRGKNLIGAFHAPSLVVTDPALAGSMPSRARAEGLVEAVKHGAILDEVYLSEVEDGLDASVGGDPEALDRVVLGSVAIKTRVVTEDEREEGFRSVLNFGHTLGHGIEAASGFAMTHGEAVALGMVLEARLGERLGLTEHGTADRLEAVVRRLDMPTELPERVGAADVLAYAARDKKARGGETRYVLLQTAGTVLRDEGWARTVPLAEVEAVLREAEWAG